MEEQVIRGVKQKLLDFRQQLDALKDPAHIISLMKHIKEIYFQFFKEVDVVRHPLVRKIVKAYEKDDAKS